ncbi:MAG TPA: SDR family oxidoreductase [Capillimicrobium sp.]|jgi:3-oxoacyl-[acyl-carrier protein] reductase
MRASFQAADGEVLVVTGGANGIGAAAARAFAAAGGHVTVLDVAPSAELEGVERVAQARVDVADRDAVLAAIADVVERHGRVDGLIAGAAVQPRVPVADMAPEDWRRTLAINLDGVVWAVQAVLPHMRKQRRGSIIAFASGLAHMGHPEASAYAASKGALIAFVKSLAGEVAGDRVRVNVVFPGVIDTPQFREANPGSERQHWLETTGIGDVADVVGPLLFLLSDAASMTGSILTRDRVFRVEDDA